MHSSVESTPTISETSGIVQWARERGLVLTVRNDGMFILSAWKDSFMVGMGMSFDFDRAAKYLKLLIEHPEIPNFSL